MYKNNNTQVTEEQIKSAHDADLHAYISHYLINDHIRRGSSLVRRDNNSVSIKSGANWWQDFATQEHGDSIDYLTKFYGERFTDAVRVLSGFCGCFPSDQGSRIQITHTATAQMNSSGFERPAQAKDNNRVFAYLTKTRCIDRNIVNALIDNGLLYQNDCIDQGMRSYSYCVFMSRTKPFAELRTTDTFGNCPDGYTKKVATGSRGYWSFQIGTKPRAAYVCEGAIDAISLYQLRRENAIYISIAGAKKQTALNEVKNDFRDICKVVLAVDNDGIGHAGDWCRRKNSDLPFILPKRKDWNEDLQSLRLGYSLKK